MRRRAPTAAALLLLVAAGAAPVLAGEEEERDYRVVDLLPDFLAYHRLFREESPEAREAGWIDLLEGRHGPFFRDVLYRGRQGEDRERIARACREKFWGEIAPRLPEIERAAAGLTERVHRVVADFRGHFPDFRADTDFYLTLSFGFRGKVTEVEGRRVLALGLELISPDGPQLPLTIAHELTHLHHFRFFRPGGGLYRDLWAEGLATYGSAVVVPGHRASVVLGFPPEKMDRCEELLPELAADFLAHMGESDHRLRRIYFGAEDNDTKVPPEAGYYLGLRIVERLVAERPLDELLRLKGEEVYPLVARCLTAIAAEKR